jgi:hypothetical protein
MAKIMIALIFCCQPDNDIYQAMRQSGYDCPRYENLQEAIENAPEGAYLLAMGDGYPAAPGKISAAQLAEVRRKHLKLYLEYYSEIPGYAISSAKHTQWERCVVASDAMGKSLPALQILMAHSCQFLPIEGIKSPLLVSARVAGYDKAILGLPEKTYPLLFASPDNDILIATTQLSRVRKARYAPEDEWKKLWKYILNYYGSSDAYPNFDWEAEVQPWYGKKDKLPAGYEQKAFTQSVDWIKNSRLFPDKNNVEKIHQLLISGIEISPAPSANESKGDGSYGFMEGYASQIKPDGSQNQRIILRADCMAEVAMVLALDWELNHNPDSKKRAENLMDYIYYNSRLCQGPRNDPQHPAYGMISWGEVAPLWEIANYTDDNARVLLATIAARKSLDSDKWDEPVLRGLLANLRTTGPSGFRNDRLDIAGLEKKGWQVFRDKDRVNYSPHHESYMWACYLWAYQQTQYEPFKEKAEKGIRLMMAGYPDKWRWRDNIERARMLLCLSWLIRVEDTPEHRAWLKKVAKDLAAYQDACGALRERPVYHEAGGAYQAQTNETYGTGETAVVQKDGDPATDQLYTTGFAILGLHEAALATGDPDYAKAEKKLAEYLCRIQIKSESYPYLQGAWFRAFDYQKWEFWASSGDAGWGAWCVESGWGQAWIATILGLRSQNISLWDYSLNPDISPSFPKALQQVPQ